MVSWSWLMVDTLLLYFLITSASSSSFSCSCALSSDLSRASCRENICKCSRKYYRNTATPRTLAALSSASFLPRPVSSSWDCSSPSSRSLLCFAFTAAARLYSASSN